MCDKRLRNFHLPWTSWLILLLAMATRSYRLGYQSLWSDEGNSVSLARAGFAEIAARTAFDIHPPFYYWLLKIWATFVGESEFGLRALSAALGVLLVGAIFGLGRRLFGERVGLAAAFVAALAPFQVYYAQETRMYMLLTLLGTLCVWPAINFWWAGSKRSIFGMFAYVVLATLGLYTQYAFPLMLVVINAPALVVLWPARRRLWIWLGLQIIPLILYLPWLPIAFRQITTWPSLVETAPAAEIGLTLLRTISFGLAATAVSNAWLGVMSGLALFGLLAGIRRWWGAIQRLQALGLVFLWLLLPAGLAAALFRPAYLKIFLIASPAFCLLVGLGIVGLARPERGRIGWGQLVLPYLAAALVAIPSLLSLDAYYHDPAFQRDNYRDIAAFLTALGTAEDAVIVHAPGQQEVFGYYYQPGPGKSAVYPLPAQRPLDPQATLAQLEALTGRARRLYGLFWATEESDPDGLIEAWLEQHTFKASDTWFGNVRLVSYAVPPAELALREVDFQLGEHIRLDGIGFWPGKIAPGEILQIRLAWETDSPIARNYTVFVQLLDAANHLVGQRDALPLTPTTGWVPGQRVIGSHGLYLEPGTPPGLHRLIAGLYDSTTGIRLPVAGGGDFVDLGTVLVIKNRSPLPEGAFQMQQRLNAPPLLGYDLYKTGHASDPEAPLYPGDPLHLNLYWQRPAIVPDHDLVALRLVNQQGEVVNVWQHQAAGVNYPLAEWSAKEIVRGQFDLFLSEIPPGTYQLEILFGGQVLERTRAVIVEPLD